MTDELPVVTVPYSPGEHLERFLSSLTVATDRPATVVIADNGSTDGALEEAVERYPNAVLLRTGGNLGYGSAVNLGVASIADGDPEFIVIANPDVVWSPGSIDALLEVARRWPRVGAVGPLIRDPDGSVYPSARQLPSIVRGGMHAVVGLFWKRKSVDRRLPPGSPGTQRAGRRLAVGILSAGPARGVRGDRRFDERYFMYMEDATGSGRAGWQNVFAPSAEILHDKGHSTGRDPARNPAAHHRSTWTYLSDRHTGAAKARCAGRCAAPWRRGRGWWCASPGGRMSRREMRKGNR